MKLLLWNSTTGEETLKLKDFKHQLTAAAFSTVGQTLALAITTTSKQDKVMTFVSTIRLYDAASGEGDENVSAQRSGDLLPWLSQIRSRLWPAGWRRATNGTGGDAGAFGSAKPAAWACSKPATMECEYH